MSKINIFLPSENKTDIDFFRKSGLTGKIFLLSRKIPTEKMPNVEYLEVDALQSSQSIRKIAENSDTDFSLLLTTDAEISFIRFSLERFVQIAESTDAGLVYSDCYELKNDVRTNHPTIDYQMGSLRDDFDFGGVLFFNASVLKKAAAEIAHDYRFAGLYALRLAVAEKSGIFHINEFLYETRLHKTDAFDRNDTQFAYVNPQNREVQIEMERACTEHLRKIGALLQTVPDVFPKSVILDEQNFPVEASVIIPVKNREKTIGDAVKSVLAQRTDFSYNLIIIDNHSTDGTSQIIENQAKTDRRIIHLIPENENLGIGGCWNEGIGSEHCGRFAVQLDSDDIYADCNTLQQIIDRFYQENCAMVIGSYTITDFELNPVPPYLISHSEWTAENGHNNALRINGLGAPRAFFTPIIREIKFPDTSYGEDYAVGLAISRKYKIGRIFHSLYFCRRWEGNSDAALPVEKVNANNFYKDKIRTVELMARKKI